MTVCTGTWSATSVFIYYIVHASCNVLKLMFILRSILCVSGSAEIMPPKNKMNKQMSTGTNFSCRIWMALVASKIENNSQYIHFMYRLHCVHARSLARCVYLCKSTVSVTTPCATVSQSVDVRFGDNFMFLFAACAHCQSRSSKTEQNKTKKKKMPPKMRCQKNGSLGIFARFEGKMNWICENRVGRQHRHTHTMTHATLPNCYIRLKALHFPRET